MPDPCFPIELSNTERKVIDLTINEERLNRAVQRARERDIIIPTFAEMKDPALIPMRSKAT